MSGKPYTYSGLHEPGTRSGWHFYDLSTGLFSGAVFEGAEDQARLQAEQRGQGLIQGDIDWLSQRVDPASGALLDHKPEPPYDGSDLTLYVWWWDAAIKRWQLRPRLKKLRADRWDAIKAAADDAEHADIEVAGVRYQADAQSVQQLSNKALIAALGAPGTFATQWTTADQSVVALNTEQLLQIVRAINDRAEAVRARRTALRAAIEAAASAELVDAVVWAAP